MTIMCYDICFPLFSGFLKTGTKGSAQGNFGLMDLVAGLHWLKENLPAFGGDPQRVTLMGHSTGAALVNFIAVSPAAKARSVQKEISMASASKNVAKVQENNQRKSHIDSLNANGKFVPVGGRKRKGTEYNIRQYPVN
ncbi:hypothetical protein HHI36_006284 [Cryptolaemus montrouzieri]|uniref:Carboxylic ester hydrolase n=1 Tax=Cryptolaemus montrouzieri TaxID=559131 RepID=A0ABD2NWT7_9CUCU